MFWKAIFSIGCVLIFGAAEAQAKNRISASTTWTPAQLSGLEFAPPNYRQGRIGLAFEDPRKGQAIEKIIFDPTFKPKRQMPDGSSVSDFFLSTIIKSPKTGKYIRETAFCDWNDVKAVATCIIEDDGGRFEISAVPQGAKLKLSFVVRSLGLYHGFRIAEEGAPSQEPSPIDVKLKDPAATITSPVRF